jgi:kumamolisin
MSNRNPLRTLLWTSTSLAALLLTIDTGMAQTPQVMVRPGVLLPPGSMVLNPGSTGALIVNPPSGQEQRPGYVHTNILLSIPQGGYPQFAPNVVGPPMPGYLAETPASLACIYELGVGGPDAGKGCNPNTVTAVTSGGSKAIAIVDAYDYPTAAADLAVFDTQMGVAAPTSFQVIYGTGSPSSGCVSGTKPPTGVGTGWTVEEALDIEMAHSIAPKAQLFLVEAASNSFANLLNAVQVAAACVASAGGGQVSNSYGGGEFSGEVSSDVDFTAANVVFFASAGDSPGTEYPCTSPNVICIGGTSISRNQTTGFYQNSMAWNSTGGGPSSVEPIPSYQNFMSSIVGSFRGVPDLAAIADPNFTGVWIYNSPEVGGWTVIGGTSVASPLMAGIFNFANFFYASSNDAVSNIYQIGQSGVLKPFVTDINSGLCGPGHTASFANANGWGYDPANTLATTNIPWSFCDGWGSPKDAGNPDFLRAMRAAH